MRQAAVDLKVVSQNIADGRTEDAERNLDLAQAHARSASSKTDGPIVWIGSKLPFLGDDVSAMQTAAQVMDSLANDTLADMVAVSEGLSPQALKPRNGKVNLAPIQRVRPVIAEVSRDVELAVARMEAVDVEGLVRRLRGPMEELRSELGSALELSRRGETAASLLPDMLGAQGPRRYAVITQNNAEIRSGGGIPGAVAVVTADRGRMRMVYQSNEVDGFGQWSRPAVELSADERDLFGDRLAQYPQNATLTPDFTRSAEILQRMWFQKRGERLDGVVSIDPVAMSYVVAATGPVKLQNGQSFDSTNLAFGLMNIAYIVQPDYGLQDLLFATVGRAVFDKVVQGRGNPGEMLDALERAVAERRVMVWSAHASEQARLTGTDISGDMPRDATTRPQVGVFLNDSASDKMSYYLDYRADVQPVSCFPDGSQRLEVTVTLKSTAPTNVVDLVGTRLVNPLLPGPALGSLRTNVSLYSPFGGRVEEATLDGEEALLSEHNYLGREVRTYTLVLAPQQTQVLHYVVRTGKAQRDAVELRTTPTALGSGRGVVGVTACG